ncbi:MAG: Transcriptional regulatory protein ZraR [Deltaproteobacteria bacterium ADurb.Bin058]|nr:MAG: Transcriptional regulatory protein ZraR [Deltaproteobacteria bacterium ADurb.Bin058]
MDEILDDSRTAQIQYQDGHPVTLRQSKVRLLIKGEPAQELICEKDTISIGSAQRNDVVLKDRRVSREHCKIVLEPLGYVITDLGSTNGTYVNKTRVREAFLTSGANLNLGGLEMKFFIINKQIKIAPSTEDRFGLIIGRSRQMREIFTILEKISPTNSTVVLEGQTGTGKEVVSRTIHTQSLRANGPFVVFDCSAVPKDLLETELFGHERGAFTGASQSRKGLFEMADGGTLFLDEIGELGLDLQPKLLRALEHREIRRVGSNKSVPIDVRLIAATNRDLQKEVRAKRFREDLYFRLSVVKIKLPELKRRSEDIELLANHFLEMMNRQNPGATPKSFAPQALAALRAYAWPGNVRELLNVVERASLFADEDIIQLEDLPKHIAPGQGVAECVSDVFDNDFKQAKEIWVEQFEKEYLSSLLARCNGSLSAAAKEADLDRKHLRKLVRKYGLITQEH